MRRGAGDRATTTGERPRPPLRRRPFAAAAALAACVLYVLASLSDEFGSAGRGDGGAAGPRRRHLRSDGDGDGEASGEEGEGGEAHRSSLRARIKGLLARLRSDASSISLSEIGALKDELRGLSTKGTTTTGGGAAPPATGPLAAATGWGPSLSGPRGQSFRFDAGTIPDQGVVHYAALSSPRLQWNVAPYRWNTCPDGEDTSLGETAFVLRIPDPDDPGDADRVASKHLRFRVERRSARECLWNYSKSCLAGGSFVMNFGATARDVLYPGDYKLRTREGTVRVVAYNTNRDCSVRDDPGGAPPMARKDAGQTPLAYLRQVKPSAVDPEGCQSWIDRRQEAKDLFAFNSDLTTVQVDAPWMRALIQVRQNKVETDDECINARMSVWIADATPELLGDAPDGVLGGEDGRADGEGPEDGEEGGAAAATTTARHRVLKYREVLPYWVDGPFGVRGPEPHGPLQSPVWPNDDGN